MIFLPSGMVGGAAIEAASVQWIARGSASSMPVSGVDFGATLFPPNERWIVCCVQIGGASPDNIVGTPTIGGIAAPVISSGLSGEVASLNPRFVWFAAHVPAGESGAVSWSRPNGIGGNYQIFRCVNLRFDSVFSADYGAGVGSASLSISSPAGGAILGSGFFAYQSGSSASSANFNNLATLQFFSSNTGFSAAGSVFQSAQTALNTTYDPQPNTNIARSHASVISVAPVF